MKRILVIVAMVLLSKMATALPLAIYHTNDISVNPTKDTLIMHEGAYYDLYQAYRQGSTAYDLTGITTVVLTFAPRPATNGVRAWSQSVTGSVHSATGGIVRIPITSSQIATNGVFDWKISLYQNGTNTLRQPYGDFYLIRDNASTGVFSPSNIDLTGKTFVGYPWCTSQEVVNIIGGTTSTVTALYVNTQVGSASNSLVGLINAGDSTVSNAFRSADGALSNSVVGLINAGNATVSNAQDSARVTLSNAVDATYAKIGMVSTLSNYTAGALTTLSNNVASTYATIGMVQTASNSIPTAIGALSNSVAGSISTLSNNVDATYAKIGMVTATSNAIGGAVSALSNSQDAVMLSRDTSVSNVAALFREASNNVAYLDSPTNNFTGRMQQFSNILITGGLDLNTSPITNTGPITFYNTASYIWGIPLDGAGYPWMANQLLGSIQMYGETGIYLESTTLNIYGWGPFLRICYDDEHDRAWHLDMGTLQQNMIRIGNGGGLQILVDADMKGNSMTNLLAVRFSGGGSVTGTPLYAETLWNAASSTVATVGMVEAASNAAVSANTTLSNNVDATYAKIGMVTATSNSIGGAVSALSNSVVGLMDGKDSSVSNAFRTADGNLSNSLDAVMLSRDTSVSNVAALFRTASNNIPYLDAPNNFSSSNKFSDKIICGEIWVTTGLRWDDEDRRMIVDVEHQQLIGGKWTVTNNAATATEIVNYRAATNLIQTMAVGPNQATSNRAELAFNFANVTGRLDYAFVNGYATNNAFPLSVGPYAETHTFTRLTYACDGSTGQVTMIRQTNSTAWLTRVYTSAVLPLATTEATNATIYDATLQPGCRWVFFFDGGGCTNWRCAVWSVY